MEHHVVRPVPWKRADFLGDGDWTRVFGHDELKDMQVVMQEARGFNGLQADLRALKSTMDCVRNDLMDGRGFCVLRGLDVENCDPKILTHLFLRLGSYLGEIVPQNAEGDVVQHVTADAVRYDQDGSQARGHRGRARMFPHSDSSDIVGLLCVRQAKKGGCNSLCSSTAIHNEVLRTHPEYLKFLYEGFYFDLTGKTKAANQITDRRIAVFRVSPRGLSCTFNKNRIEVGMRKAGLSLDDIQQAAVSYVNDLALREEFTITLRLLSGDILFVNNHSTLHARDEYEDGPETGRERLMLRLWVNVPGMR